MPFLLLIGCLVSEVFFNFLKAENKGHLVSYELVRSHSQESIRQLFKSKKIPRFIMPVRFGVDVYEVIYRAKWIDGSWRNASGIYYVPKTEHSVPYLMYGHGTQIEKHREISDNDAQQNICLMFATDGYAAMYPDYYGIGKGEGKHLYQHAWSEAGAFIYMLYAIDELNQLLGVCHNGQLFLTGYSQGGHAAMAAHKYIEALRDPRFQVTASSPMSGAYDMTGDQEKYMFQEYPRPFYLPFLLLSYQEAYNFFPDKNIYTIFKSPFDTLLPLYFENNEHKSLYELNQLLPKVPKDIVKDSLVNIYMSDPYFVFKERLCDNSLTSWRPRAPVLLCYCKGDREVSYKNAEAAYREMRALGATDVRLNNLSDRLDHNSCAAFAVLATKYFFNRFRDKGNNPHMKDLPLFKKFLVGFVKRAEERKYARNKKDRAYM